MLNIVVITHTIIIVLLLFETSSRLRLKDSIQFSVLTSSIVLFLSTLINNYMISKINSLVETSMRDPESGVFPILRAFFIFLDMVGKVIGKENIPFFLQVIIMLILFGLLKGYIRRILENSRLIVPLGTVPVQQPAPGYYPFNSGIPNTGQRNFTLGANDEAPSLADVEKLKNNQPKGKDVKKLTGKLVEGTKIGVRGTIEVIGGSKKFKDEEVENTGDVIVPKTAQQRITRIIQQEEDNESLSEEVMKKQIEEKRKEEKEMTKQLANLIKTNVDVNLNVSDKNTAWNMALDYLQGYVMDSLQIPPNFALDASRYRVLQVLDYRKQGYFKFDVEFFLSANTIYYFDVYVFNDGSVQVFLKNVLKY